MTLRIIGGELGGRPIRAPAGAATRPTRALVREAWFNVLADRLAGSRVLDLFAGSGALGLEALSRGAQHVCFVESSARARATLTANIRALGVADRTRVRAGDAFAAVREAAAEPGLWDIVLADPPYRGDAAPRLATAFSQRAFGRILCVEHAPGVRFPIEPDWQRSYGETTLSMFLDPAEGASHD